MMCANSLILILILLTIITNSCNWNTTCCTPPSTGSYYYDPNAGKEMYRTGPVSRVSGWIYINDILKEEGFKTDTGYVEPSKYPNILANPLRKDGTGLNSGYGLGRSRSFNGHIPIYTENNNWPFVGLCNPIPPYCDFDGDTGIYFQKSEPVETEEPKTVPGSSGALVTNAMNYSFLISSASRPGNEQPGQVMTIVNPGDTKPLPIPPKNDGSPTGKFYLTQTPKLFVSVAGLDPKDAPGFHASHIYPDTGTCGFAYDFASFYNNSNYLILGFNKNEGYDPINSGDPGYGVALYIDNILSALTDLYSISSNSAQQDLWALPKYNPMKNAEGGLSAYPSVPYGTKVIYKFISHQETQLLLSQKSPILHQTYSA